VTRPACRCYAPIADDAYLCGGCSDRLKVLLSEVPGVAEDLQDTRLRLNRTGGPKVGVTSRSADKPLPWNQTASDAQEVLETVLAYRARVVAQRLRKTLTGSATNEALSKFLLRHFELLRHDQDAPDALDELSDAIALARRVVDLAPDQWYAGQCGHSEPAADGSGPVVCPADLYARVGAEWVDCRVCCTRYDVAERRKWLLQLVEDQLATMGELSAALSTLGRPLTKDSINGYVKRGRLTAHGVNQRGYPVYRVGDLLDLIAEPRPERKARPG
jgi:hypothetical protein